MYSDGQVLGASTAGLTAVSSLPLTSSNTTFQLILVAIAAVALTILVVRTIKLVVIKRAK